jgi:beta-glucanase (GH16 family)
MVKIIILFVSIVVFISCSNAILITSNWNDEFDSLTNFQSKWNFETGKTGWGNGEWQNYTTTNARLANGNLEILTQQINGNYFSARLISKDSFRYGTFEFRARLPWGRGTWPAMWLLAAKRPLNWPSDGEIDVMEHVGYDQVKNS